MSHQKKKKFFEKISKKFLSVRNVEGHKGIKLKNCFRMIQFAKKSNKKFSKILGSGNPLFNPLSRTRFLSDMRFSQKVQQQYALTVSNQNRDN